MDEQAARQAFEAALESYRPEFGRFFLARFLGLEISYADEVCVVEIDVKDFMFNPQGSLHGGVIAFALDVSMGHLIKRSIGRAGITLEMKTQYLRSAGVGRVRCEGRFLKKGRSIVSLEFADDERRRQARRRRDLDMAAAGGRNQPSLSIGIVLGHPPTSSSSMRSREQRRDKRIVTSHLSSGRDCPKRRCFRAASRLSLRAAGVEAAARRRARDARDLAFEHDRPLALRRVDRRHRGEQRRGVGMRGGGKQLLRRRFLDDLAEVHHRGAVRDAADDVEIVADDEVGQPQLALQVEEQVQEVALHGEVEAGGRFVRDDDLGPEDERARDGRRGAPGRPRSDADISPKCPATGRGAASASRRGTMLFARQIVDADRLGDQAADRHARRERGDGVLQQHLRAAAEGEGVPLQHRIERLAGNRRLRRPSGRVSPISTRHSVVLPEPLSPTRPTTSSASSARLTSSSARTRPPKTTATFSRASSAGSHAHARMQAARRPGATSRSAGTPARQASTRKGQRGAKMQAVDRLDGLGTSPGIERRRPFVGFVLELAGEQRRRVGVASARRAPRRPGRSRRPCRHTSRRDRRRAARRARDGAR